MLRHVTWVCHDCGIKLGHVQEGHLSAMHEGVCDICKEAKIVTEARDYGLGGLRIKTKTIGVITRVEFNREYLAEFPKATQQSSWDPHALVKCPHCKSTDVIEHTNPSRCDVIAFCNTCGEEF